MHPTSAPARLLNAFPCRVRPKGSFWSLSLGAAMPCLRNLLGLEVATMIHRLNSVITEAKERAYARFRGDDDNFGRFRH